jgi:hypothetical protein
MGLWRKFVLGFVPRKKVALPPCQRLSTSVQYDSCATRRGAQPEPSMRAIVKAAFKIRELHQSLLNISQDDNKEIEDYTDSEIVNEAKYVLSTYFESGHINNDMFNGEYGAVAEREATQDIRKMKVLIAKYEKI